jgi:uncharacterized protein with HEPN domain
MEFTSLIKRERVRNTFEQIDNAINQLKEWNVEVNSAEDYYLSSGGMQKLAANCMLIEAIGEGIKKIDEITKGELLPERSEIPWPEVIGIRNHIAHGYFDINGYLVFDTIKNDLEPLQNAIRYFLDTI